jgi:hypothetical protein
LILQKALKIITTIISMNMVLFIIIYDEQKENNQLWYLTINGGRKKEKKNFPKIILLVLHCLYDKIHIISKTKVSFKVA